MKRPSELISAEEEVLNTAIKQQDDWLTANLKYREGLVNVPAGAWLDLLKDDFAKEAKNAEWDCTIVGQSGDYMVTLTPKKPKKKQEPQPELQPEGQV